MAKTVFVFTSGRSVTGLSAQVVGESLEEIRTQHEGVLKPEHVVNAAQEETHPLHTVFTWDDTEAARLHRLNEARRVISTVRVVTPANSQPVKAFVSVRTPNKGRGYIPLLDALSDEEIKVRVILEIKVAIESLERKYAAFSAAAEVLERLKKAAG
jgi:hypothetical protein